jgi:VanZ family protein
MLPLRYPRAWLALAWIAVAAVFIAGLLPMRGGPSLGLINDKALHAIGYAALTVILCGIFRRSRYVWIALGLFAMGLSIEYLQDAMGYGRQREWLDVVANSIGILAGAMVALAALGGWALRVESFLTNRRR